MKTYQRLRAVEKRKQEKEEKKDDSQELPYFGTSICRDEKAVERERGTV